MARVAPSKGIECSSISQNIDMRQALSRCGSLAENDRSIDPNIRAFLLSGGQPASMS
ncbi:hypothetical protein ACFPL7_18795 [Dongia soli]|uniref:Uncharacterized protein n=1 Tax=Dongia soli TaxID=600628 RepID=A0ABU5E5R0_9PROT|nr:hypothetical protein [Dongia soli]MDY0881642.1 hypothetical protein [Dongia soli]